MKREMKNTKVPELRYQVGYLSHRNEQCPVWEGRKVVGYMPGKDLVDIFVLEGFGATEAAALKMAEETRKLHKALP